VDTFLFFAEKPESSDYCKGCHMCDYASDVIFEPELSKEEVIKHWSRCFLKNLDLEINEAGYETIRILKNGRSLGGLANDDSLLEEYETFSKELEDMEREAKNDAQTFLVTQKANEKREAENRKLQEQKAREEAERTQLETLLKKYPQNNV